MASNSLKAAAKRGLPVENWRSADLADRMARRSAGLDHEDVHNVNVAMQLINLRLEKSLTELPKDALPEGDPSSFEYGLPTKQLQAPAPQPPRP